LPTLGFAQHFIFWDRENINPVGRQDNPAESGEARPTCFAPLRTGVNGGDEHD